MGEFQGTASSIIENMTEDIKSIHHILIVDDEVEFVGSVRRHLRRKGFYPDFAFNGESACKKMLSFKRENHQYDLVITDVVMPRMDGISLLQWIHESFPETSVMVVSEFMDMVQLESKIRPELDEIGRKPITPEQMIRLIESISFKRVAWRREDDCSRQAPAGKPSHRRAASLKSIRGSMLPDEYRRKMQGL